MQASVLLLAQYGDDSGGGGLFGMVYACFWLAVIVLMLAGWWKMFEKANQPGWAAIIPIYNVIILLKIAGKPVWWLILYVIPLINLVPAIMVPIEVAKNFGKSGGFAVGLIFLPMIFYPILGFGDARYSPRHIETATPVQTL